MSIRQWIHGLEDRRWNRQTDVEFMMGVVRSFRNPTTGTQVKVVRLRNYIVVTRKAPVPMQTSYEVPL